MHAKDAVSTVVVVVAVAVVVVVAAAVVVVVVVVVAEHVQIWCFASGFVPSLCSPSPASFDTQTKGLDVLQ